MIRRICGTIIFLVFTGLFLESVFPVEIERQKSAPAGISAAFERLSPEKGVEIMTNRKWSLTHWAGDLQTRSFSLDNKGEFPRFMIGEPQKRCVWTYYLALPIDFNIYPIVAFKYIAQNTTTTKIYVIWLDDGTGPDFGGISLINSNELIPDGKVHVLKKDLREYHPKGPITGIALGVMCGDATPAVFDLAALNFETPPDTPLKEPLKEDVLFNFLVVNVKDEPIKGAKVIVDAERANFARAGLTDEKGLCKIKSLKNEVGKHMVRVEADGMVPVEHLDIKNAISEDPLKITLHHGIRVGGVVKDETGNPINRATVSLSVALNEKENIRSENKSVGIMTDTAGRWQSPLLPADAEGVYVRLSHPDFISDQVYQERFSFKETQRQDDIVMVMKRGVSFSGKVTDKDGALVLGAQLLIGPDAHGYQNPIATSDKDGHFGFGDLPPGETIVTIQHPAYAARIEKVRLPVQDEMNIILEKGKVLFGKVVNKNGEPIPGAWIISDGWLGFRTLELSQKTNDKGEFRFDNAPDGTIEFDIMAEGYADKRNLPLATGDTPHEIIMSAPLNLSGRVIDAETGQPIRRFRIMTGTIFSEGEKVYWGDREKEFEDKEGTFEITLGFPQKGYKLRASAEGYAYTEYPETFSFDKSQETKDIVLALKKGLQIKGKVYSAGRKPLRGVRVVLGGQDDHIRVEGVSVTNQDRVPVKDTYTDEGGNFLFNGLNEESYQILFLHPEEGIKLVSGLVPSKGIEEIQLEHFAEIEGFAYENDRPLADFEISLYPHSSFLYSGNQPFSFSDRTRTDQTGHWSFGKVIPSAYDASIMVSVSSGTMYRSYSKGRKKVDLKPDEKKFIVLGGVGGPVLTGKVVDPEGKPVIGAEVSLRNVSSRYFYYTTTQSDGTYKIPEIEPGRYYAGFALYEREAVFGYGPGKVVMEGNKKVIIKPDFPEAKLDITLNKITTFSAGDVAPNFIAETLKGEKVSLISLRGKPVFLDFWAIWCGPCVEEIPSVKNAYEKYKNEVVFIGINLDSSRETLEKFVKTEKMEWPQIFDGKGWEGELVKKYGVRAIPATLLIDRDGKIAAKDLRGERIMQALEGLIKK